VPARDVTDISFPCYGYELGLSCGPSWTGVISAAWAFTACRALRIGPGSGAEWRG